MLNTLSAAARAFDARIGWHRLGVAAGIVVIAIAMATLFHMLRDVELSRVMTALKATPSANIAMAAVFVAAAYVTLTFYDLFSLRTIGRADVPYHVAAFASFTSFSIGHNIGATVFTGGAVRYRIYSAWGLSIVDVAKIAFVTGLTFWLGNAFMLGLGMLYHPEAASAVNQLPPWVNSAIAIAGLAAIAGYIAWLLPKPRVIGRDSWQVTLPSAPFTLVQIGIGVLDLGSAALAMYMLMPAEPAIDIVTVVVIFVLSTLLGFASHAPGSIGVFDAAMLVALQQFEKEQLLASLLLFRLLYFIVPFALALTLLGVREAWLSLRATR